MSSLALPAKFPLPNLITELSERDTMFDGSDEHYLSVGISALRAVEMARGDGPAPCRILDLPCGHGRVTRALRARFPEAAITVCDIDRQGVDFASSRFGAHGIYSRGDFRSLALGKAYDLIWVGSLITHLPEVETRRLLDCMMRHMSPHSTLVVSSHGDFVAERMRSWTYGLASSSARALLEDHAHWGYGYRDYPNSKGYGISLISRRWVDRALRDSPLRLDDYVERGWDNHQDILVLRLSERLRGGKPADRLRRGASWIVAKMRADLSRGVRQRAVTRMDARWTPPAHVGWFEAAFRPPAEERPPGGCQMPDLDRPVRDFDEHWYLETYPDVLVGIERGQVRSGLDHYLQYGSKEGRLPCAPKQETTPTSEGTAPSGECGEA